MIYPSKKDWWVALLFLLSIVTALTLGLVQIYQAIFQAAPVSVLLSGLLTLLVGLLLLWFSSTSYEITESDLLVRCGPFRRTIPLDRIAEVRPKQGFFLEMGWNFALSHNKLFIKYRQVDGRLARFGIAISPEDQEGFLRELAQAVPGLKADGHETPDGGRP